MSLLLLYSVYSTKKVLTSDPVLVAVVGPVNPSWGDAIGDTQTVQTDLKSSFLQVPVDIPLALHYQVLLEI